MEKKKMYYVIGGVVVLGIGLYLWNKSKKTAEVKEVSDTTKTDSSTDVTAPTTAPTTTPTTAPAPTTAPTTAPKKLTAEELESKLQSGCGKKPKLKKNIVKYNQCRADLTAKLKSQGLVAFDGSNSFEGVAEKYNQNVIRENSFAEQVTNREDGRMFAGYVYND